MLDAGQASFVGLTDTPATLGTPGQATIVNPAADGLVFGGPYQPLEAPNDPTNLRVTDAFDMALELRWNSVTGVTNYEWQRRLSSGSWPATPGTMTTSTTVRATGLTLGTYDFRVRAVGVGGLMNSNWVSVTGIPLIVTPTPAAATTRNLQRNGSARLRLNWNDLDVNNGGSWVGPRYQKHRL